MTVWIVIGIGVWLLLIVGTFRFFLRRVARYNEKMKGELNEKE